LNAQVETIAQQKRLLRQKILGLRKGLKTKDLQEKSQAICNRLLELPEFVVSQKCLFYLPIKGEINTQPIIQRSFGLGKEVYLPLIDVESRGLKICRIPDLEIEFVENSFGIPEPGKEHWDIVEAWDLDFIFAPGLAFDAKGGRVGYGGGYYDRLLKNCSPNVDFVAGAFAFQIVDEIPQDSSDVPVSKIITEDTTLDCQVR
jgi:5-formyltetrahydrofolate cyclo-ligase